MPMRNGKKGDLIIHFDIQFPESFSPFMASEIASTLNYQPTEQKDDVCEEVELKDADVEKLKQEYSHSSSHRAVCFCLFSHD